MGYAFHPPAVAWFIAFFQQILGGWLGPHSTGLVRLPAALTSAIILSLSLRWLEKCGMERSFQARAASVILSFLGFFSLSWMMVPDIPLFLGWMIVFTKTWEICFLQQLKRHCFWVLGLGSALVLLSKYSGVLAIFSAALSVLIWAPRQRRLKALFSLTGGGLLASLPILIWNSQHQWASILYQIHDRHAGGSLSFLRYAKFWGVEAVFAGPVLVVFGVLLLIKHLGFRKKFEGALFHFIFVWMAPAATVFLIQPLFSDFKPHWAFIVWWPALLALAWMSQSKSWRWIKYQVFYGLGLGGVVILSCHLPLGSWLVRGVSHSQFDPRLDVTNDFYGWSDLNAFITKIPNQGTHPLPVVGSRYQTAAQAAFALNQVTAVTFLPRDLKEKDEWMNLNISDGQGPEWPRLTTPVLYVSDNRYSEAPQFPSATCQKQGRLEKTRFNLRVKWIDVWRCDP